MPRHARRTRSSRHSPSRRRKNNPSFEQLLAGILVVGSIAAVTILVVQHYRRPRQLPEGALPGLPPLTQLTPPASGVVGDLCENAARYPGFVWDGSGCTPGAATPAGVYVSPDCTDFYLKDGVEGPQVEFLAELRKNAANASRWNDPTDMVTTYLKAFWPECTWPPSPTAPARIVQMFMALSFLLGREILLDARETETRRRRGRVLGQSDSTAADEAVAERLAELGFTSWDPAVVPEIELPAVPVSPPFHPPEEPGPPPGGIVPPGGVFPVPGGQGLPTVDTGEGPTCAVLAKTDDGSKALAAGWWDTTITEKVTSVLVRAPGEACKEYKVVFGLCLTSKPGVSYGLLTQVNDGIVVSPSGGFGIDNGFGIPDLKIFRVPAVWKGLYEAKIVYPQGGGAPNMILTKSTEEVMDACPSLEDNWPAQPGIGHYRIKVGDGDWRKWFSEPKVKLVASGSAIVSAEITFSPLPSFGVLNDEGVALVSTPGVLAPAPQYDLAWKTWSIGMV